jgi:hypothetical protein
MALNREETGSNHTIQIFELTMDNDEDQDELNRRLRKIGEPECCAPAKSVRSAKAPVAATETAQE